MHGAQVEVIVQFPKVLHIGQVEQLDEPVLVLWDRGVFRRADFGDGGGAGERGGVLAVLSVVPEYPVVY
jgi:hypothetical protein